jgi:hypothetical protein
MRSRNAIIRTGGETLKKSNMLYLIIAVLLIGSLILAGWLIESKIFVGSEWSGDYEAENSYVITVETTLTKQFKITVFSDENHSNTLYEFGFRQIKNTNAVEYSEADFHLYITRNGDTITVEASGTGWWSDLSDINGVYQKYGDYKLRIR